MLPSAFKPHQVEKRNLIRLGPKYDGGYIVHKKSLDKITSIITCGLNDDWNFEKEFLKKTSSYSDCLIRINIFVIFFIFLDRDLILV